MYQNDKTARVFVINQLSMIYELQKERQMKLLEQYSCAPMHRK